MGETAAFANARRAAADARHPHARDGDLRAALLRPRRPRARDVRVRDDVGMGARAGPAEGASGRAARRCGWPMRWGRRNCRRERRRGSSAAEPTPPSWRQPTRRLGFTLTAGRVPTNPKPSCSRSRTRRWSSEPTAVAPPTMAMPMMPAIRQYSITVAPERLVLAALRSFLRKVHARPAFDQSMNRS